jgi:hypothetical protein
MSHGGSSIEKSSAGPGRPKGKNFEERFTVRVSHDCASRWRKAAHNQGIPTSTLLRYSIENNNPPQFNVTQT